MQEQHIQQAAQQLQSLEEQIERAVIGQKKIIREVITALVASGHVLVEGVPGLGKTLLVRALTKAIGGSFSRIQFTPDLMPTDISGHALFDFKSNEFHIRKGPVFCNFLLADEINRAPAKTQSALLEAMQEKQVTIEGDSYPLEPPFMVMATQNPIEQEGTYPLPQAQLDRFLVKIMIDYPGQHDEQKLVTHVTTGMVGDSLDISRVESVLDPANIRPVMEERGFVGPLPVATAGEMSAARLAGQATAALEAVAAEALPPEMTYSWSNMSFQEKRASGTAALVFMFSLLFVFLILAAQYESWTLPFGVIFTVPIARSRTSAISW